MAMTKRIPVSKTVWEQIGEVKKAGETYDVLLRKMLQAYHRMKLKEKMDAVEQQNKEELVALDDL